MSIRNYLFLATAAMLPLPGHAAALPAAAPAPANADDATERADSDTIVVVASGVSQPVDETARSVTVIDRAEIEQRQTVALSDLLATTAGVSVTRNGGPGSVTSLRIRGAESDQTLVLIDGVRVNDPSQPGGGFDFGNLLTSSIERVEVLRGANAVAWGSQAIGGVVNVVTQQPVNGLAARASAEYGSANQVSTTGAVAAGNDRVQGAVTAGYFRTDGISQAAVGTEKDGYRQFGATGRLTVKIIDGLEADLRAYYAHSKVELDGFPAPSYSFADTAEYSTIQEVYGYAGLNAVTGPVKHRVSFTIADVNRDNYDPATGSAPLYSYRGRSERYAYQGDATLGMLRLVAGAEHETSRYFDQSKLSKSQDITSFYGEAILTPVEALTLSAGVRNDDHSGFGNHWTWNGNAALRVGTGTVLHASYGDGFKAPTLYQRFSDYGLATLKPETAESFEAGVRQTLPGNIRAGVTWFQRDTENQIDFDPRTYRYFNIAKSRTRGVELELEANPVTALTLRASYTHLNAQNRSNDANFGKDLARRPNDIGSLSADYRFGEGGPSLGATLLMVGDSFDNAANSYKLDGYTLVGIRGSVPLTRQVELFGRVDNLFDRGYTVVRGYGTQGRTAFGGVRLRFN